MTTTATGKVRRQLPGTAQRNRLGQVEFRRGVVIYASPRIQYVEMDDRLHKLVYLIGDTFIYWCPRCLETVWEAECQAMRRRICPFCAGPVQIVGVGEKVRLHFRYYVPAVPKHEHDGWASWWAEKWEW